MHQTPSADIQPYGTMPDGRPVRVFTLTNDNGLRARVSDYGALLLSMEIPDRDGRQADVVHGFDTLDGWLTNEPYFGATIGRFGNRIARGSFTLDGIEYLLATNNDPGGIPCHLHGGLRGFDKALWELVSASADAITLRHVSPDGDEGYPGDLTVLVTYRLTGDNELIWQAEATTDAPTVVNLVHHSYWNLSGNPATTILDHVLTLEADHFLPTDAGLIPTGEIRPVAGTPMDFTRPHAIGARLGESYEPLVLGNGYDHCWVLRPGNGVRPAARVTDPKSGRVMEVLTDQPGVQFYDASFLDGIPGKGGTRYGSRSALCLETENFPDAPNQPGFPSAVLRLGETYRHTLVHRFTAE
ncbi:MAG: galactose mutarotase [Akkermansiaceae bacterium]|jgi:aldose 1-epimerase|nr:galactose mutarotase [Akkermansiaceae bacterium]